MYDVPSLDDVRQVVITRESVEKQTAPEVVLGEPPLDIKEA
jgi:ATP-dependent protease Clp ATPase subunit